MDWKIEKCADEFILMAERIYINGKTYQPPVVSILIVVRMINCFLGALTTLYCGEGLGLGGGVLIIGGC